ncbi:RluA family pseudouridine synthase [Sphingomonas sp. DT-207]|uniref:RluA family pseudouridine synthase n=1 Tax=Sphingomonas sp. DT-207 TaxID=3396167 RepID=UPI003F1B963B
MTRGVSTIEARISEGADGWRLDRALADAVPALSRERLKVLISSGAVTGPDGLARDPSKKAAAGTLFSVAIPDPTPAHNEAQEIPLDVVFEDEHLIVIDKPAGLVVHPAAGNLDGTLVNALLHHCAGQLSGIGGVARPGIVHRIDKDTSGLMVAAKTDRAHEGLARQFKAHSIDRRYKAIVSGRPKQVEGTVNASLARSPVNRKKIAVVREGKGKHAITHWRLLRQLRDAALVECRLETGRTHQVRVHMASIGLPLVGDPVYGRVGNLRDVLETLNFRRQALHAAHLGFIHPIDSHALAFDSEMPADMQELFNKLIV